MPFIPHREDDIQAMLHEMGIKSIAELFDEIPQDLKVDHSNLPTAMSESELMRFMQDKMPDYKAGTCYLGAGAYEHYIPAVVWELARRGEFYTAYTPYQAEASQGSLQIVYEYQSMITRLMAMEVSNASLYDGSTALTESLLMAVRTKRGKVNRIVVPGNLNPRYLQVMRTFMREQDIELDEIGYNSQTGNIDMDQYRQAVNDKTAAVIIAMPHFFGGIEDVHQLTDYAHQHNALVIACVNPIAASWIVPPGEWGETGADIACGEGQPLGIPLSLGGPYFGFMCTRKSMIRQIPGRIVGKTVDQSGHHGYVLTLRAREQDIRRSKATSNICTNQGLMVVAATIFMRLKGSHGLRKIAEQSHRNAVTLYQSLISIDGVEPLFSMPFFHEFAIKITGVNIAEFIRMMKDRYAIDAGVALSEYHSEHSEVLLIAVTETKTTEDLQRYHHAFFNVYNKEFIDHDNS